MFDQKDQLRRDMLSNPAIFQYNVEGIKENMAPCIHTSDRYNAIFGLDDFNKTIIHACSQKGQISGCAESARIIRSADNGTRTPSDQWFLKIAKRTNSDEILSCFSNLAASNLQELFNLGIYKPDQPLDLAIDAHLISRYDKNFGVELVRSKPKNGTSVFERYVTIQCVTKNNRLTLGITYMPALEDMADFVRKLIDFVHQLGVKIGTLMMDREFFASSVMGALEDFGVTYLIPCKDTPGVIPRLAEFDAGKRAKISDSEISGVAGTIPYTMIVTKRKKPKKPKKGKELLPHEKYIGFATNKPDLDVEEYARRWGIETGYRMIENVRARTHSKDPVVRLLCFVYSVAFFNAWVMLNATLLYHTGIYTDDSLVTQQHQKNMTLFHYVFSKLPPEPPPTV